MTKYEFDFSGMLAWDTIILHEGTMTQRMAVMHKYTVGGIENLLDRELSEFVQIFVEAYNEYCASYETKKNASLRDMLDGIEGLLGGQQ